MDKYKFGEFIYLKRKELNMTQTDLGYKLGVSNKAVSKWETGETLPDVPTLEKLASALNVTIDELVTQIKPKEKEIEVVYVKRKKPMVVAIIASALAFFLFLAFVITLGIHLFPNKAINEYNYKSYCDINPCVESQINGTSITIKGEADYGALVDSISLTINIVVHYYYYDEEEKECEITYMNKKVTFDNDNTSFELVLEPKSDLSFKSFKSMKIDYSLVEVTGSLKD